MYTQKINNFIFNEAKLREENDINYLLLFSSRLYGDNKKSDIDFLVKFKKIEIKT